MSEYTHVRRVGAYLFFAVCAFGVSMLAYAFAAKIGAVHDVTRYAANIAGLAAFMALRDMTKRPPA